MRQPLRILIVTTVHDPEDARIRYRQIPALQEAGHQVAYAAPFSAFDREPPTGVRALDLPRSRGRRRLRALCAARALIARSGPAADAVLIHDPDLIPAVAGQVRGLPPVVWDVHEDTSAALSMRDWVPAPIRRPLAAMVGLAERYMQSRHRLILAEHGYQKRFSRPHPVVPNTVPVPSASPPPPGDERVVYLGKITRARGGRELIELARRVPEIRIEVIGPAEQEMVEDLRQAVQEDLLTWTGFLPNRDALLRLPGALAGISLLHDEPNYSHSPPTKLMEYMAHGIPTLTTPNPASAHLVRAAGAGAVVPFGDVDAAARVLRGWRADAAERRQLGAAGYRYAREELDWSTDAVRFVRDLERLVAR